MQLFNAETPVTESVYKTATVFPNSRSLPEFALLDQDGELFTDSRLAGNWTLLFMGFTNCGHVCPMTMAKMRAIKSEMKGTIDVLFVSVDPDRDTVDVVRDYVDSFDASFTGVTGDPAEVDKLANALGAPYFVDQSEDGYIVDHSAALFLIDPTGAYAGVMSAPHDVQAIVSDLSKLLNIG